ncbi:MAG: hypothetical protein NT062_19490 [Proteobacteria bacterium]|nr:hypothetical protein [Pseudomonadota bacterium]
MRWLYVTLYVVGLLAYGAVASDRLGHQSGAPHFVFQADAWLHGHASIEPPYPNDDWAQIETVALRDGSERRGRRMVTRPMFKTLTGDEVPLAQIARSLGRETHVSFPAFPAVIMLPSALVGGRAANDVIPTVLVAALILPLTLLALRRLAAAKLSQRGIVDDLWLVAALGFGSVMFFAAVQGKVWFTAHVVGVVLALLYAWGSVEAAHPIVAGLALGAAAMTRTPMAFMFPLFVLEAWRMAAGDKRAWIRRLIPFALPVVAIAALGMIYNLVRFGSPTEFGHAYLALGTGQPVRQQYMIEQWGLFDLHYLARNLVVAFGLLPELLPKAPWLQVSGHGLAIWVTSPFLLALLVWPREPSPIRRALWITVATVALPSLMYMNTGWLQFGYRFSLDYTVFLVLLLALTPRLHVGAKVAIVVGVVVNLAGAITFDRMWPYYRYGGNAFDVIASNIPTRLIVMGVVVAAAAGYAAVVIVRRRR